MKVLVVDPDSTRAATVAEALAGSGAQAAVAPSASFALTMLEWNQQDVIISRAQVGDMDGPEFCSMIRADPSTAAIRFVLIASGVTPAQGSQMGVDLVIPEGLIGPAIVTRVMHLMRRDAEVARPVAPEAPAAAASPAPAPENAASPEPTPALPASPEPAPPPVSPEPAPPLPASPESEPVLAASEPAPSIAASAAPPVESAPAFEPMEIIPLPLVAPPPAPPPPSPPPAPPPPSPPPAAAARPTPPVSPLPKGAAPPPPPLTELEAVGMNGAMRTFQGALGSLALEDLTQAIVKGSKTGRLLVVLGTGGGMIAFESGRIVHAEVGNTTGDTAFQSLVAASHRDVGGKFCFIPSAPRDLTNVPKTITRSVAELLSGAAQAINEGR